MRFSVLPMISVLAAVVSAAPISISVSHLAIRATGPTSDAPFTVSTADVSSTITCPKTIQKKAGGVVLLVHGTGSDAKKNWEGGPYLEQLPGLDPGFDVCYIDLPGHALGDAQDTAEYVARAVQILAPQSSTKKVAFIAHSQGNLNVQWALTFWPSIRSSVSSYAALAGDYKGTTIGAFLCDAQNLTTGGCLPATWQQKPNSNFLQTLGNAGGLSALVPSTSLRTQYDDVVQPESGPEEQTSSYLAGASNILLQDLCDAAHLADHFSMVVDSAAFEAAYQTVKLSQAIPKNQIDKRACTSYFRASGLQQSSLTSLPTLAKSAFYDIMSLTIGGKTVSSEPAIKNYAKTYAP